MHTVEQEGTVDQKTESDNLKPLERLPVESQRDKPDEKSTASINNTTGSSRDTAGDRDTKEVETSD